MRKLLALLVFSSACLVGVPAGAAVITITDLAFGNDTPSGPPPAGTTGFIENLNNNPPVPLAGNLANFSDAAMTFSTTGAEIVNGSVAGQYQAPLMSGGRDTTNYLSVFGGTTETITLKSGILGQVFGLYIGSLDTYNTIQFYSGNTLLTWSNLGGSGTVTGTNIANATGLVASQYPNTDDPNANRYVFFSSDTPFTKIVLGSSNNSFEVDNLALAYTGSLSQSVPEASTWVMMILGFVSVGLVGYRRTGLRLRLV
jgi:hypothetical protein